MSTARKMFLLQYGAERVNKGVSVRDGGARLYWEPVIGIVLLTDRGWVLMESGLGRAALDSSEAQEAYVHSSEHYGSTEEGLAAPAHLAPEPPAGLTWTWGLEGDPMVTALASVGLGVSDLSLAVMSHLHLDHAGGIRQLAEAGIPVMVQREELDFAMSDRAALDDGYFRPDYEGFDVNWEPIDGDMDIAGGLSVLFTPGHTPGHMSYVIDLPQTGSWLFAVDAADLGENLHEQVPIGTCSGGTAEDERAAETSLARVLEEAQRRSARLVPGHDQAFWTAVRHPEGGHL